MIGFTIFTGRDDADRLRRYRHIKYKVFVEEMQFDRLPHAAADELADEDPWDADGVFVLASMDDGTAIGVVRGTVPAHHGEIYRGDLYAAFLGRGECRGLDGRVGTINSLAVLASHRLLPIPAPAPNCGKDGRCSVADELMRRGVLALGELGAALIVLSAIEGPSHTVIARQGFRLLGPIRVMRGHEYSTRDDAPDLRIYDMAMVVPGARPDGADLAAVDSYLDGQHRRYWPHDRKS